MNFAHALSLLSEGKRIIRKKDKEQFDQQWFSLGKDGFIYYMNEVWQPDLYWLQQCVEYEDWINVEEDCNYHDHNDKTGECRK